MNFVLTPTEDWLLTAASTCKARLIVASPFITGDALFRAAEMATAPKRMLVTSLSLDAFARGASSHAAVCKLATIGVEMYGLAGLHSKVYIVDNTALVTSANATYSGMRSNWECGVELTNTEDVNKLAEITQKGFGGKAEQLKLAELRQFEPKIDKLKELYKKYQVPSPPADAPKVSLPEGKGSELLPAFTGWQHLVFSCVLQMRSEQFTRDELGDVCEPLARRQFPDARTPRQTMSRIMQELRDMGLVEFVNRGKYRRLVS